MPVKRGRIPARVLRQRAAVESILAQAEMNREETGLTLREQGLFLLYQCTKYDAETNAKDDVTVLGAEDEGWLHTYRQELDAQLDATLDDSRSFVEAYYEDMESVAELDPHFDDRCMEHVRHDYEASEDASVCMCGLRPDHAIHDSPPKRRRDSKRKRKGVRRGK